MSEQPLTVAAPAAAVTAAGVTLARFNDLDRVEAVALVRPCLDVDRWVDAVVDGRPYADLAALVQSATEASGSFTTEELGAALAHHPRIGQSADGSSKEAELSRGEQAGLQVDDDLSHRLRQGNAAYERRFDRIFLIRAAGRSAAEVLAALERRLENDDATEDRVVGEQLGQIAVVRLNGLVSP
ncbi:MAG: 2-oxo-4-hydroxy-4-carboxy-5-ureidoimidazoline decarboxylase [Nostocoides sp.]